MQMLLKSLERIFRTRFYFRIKSYCAKCHYLAQRWKNGDRIGSCWVAKRNCIFSRFSKYNDQTKEIYFDQLDYVLDTKVNYYDLQTG
jgi:hypothetical protein